MDERFHDSPIPNWLFDLIVVLPIEAGFLSLAFAAFVAHVVAEKLNKGRQRFSRQSQVFGTVGFATVCYAAYASSGDTDATSLIGIVIRAALVGVIFRAVAEVFLSALDGLRRPTQRTGSLLRFMGQRGTGLCSWACVRLRRRRRQATLPEPAEPAPSPEERRRAAVEQARLEFEVEIQLIETAELERTEDEIVRTEARQRYLRRLKRLLE